MCQIERLNRVFAIRKEWWKCMYIVALLFQITEYRQLNMTEISDEPTCTQLLQQ